MCIVEVCDGVASVCVSKIRFHFLESANQFHSSHVHLNSESFAKCNVFSILLALCKKHRRHLLQSVAQFSQLLKSALLTQEAIRARIALLQELIVTRTWKTNVEEKRHETVPRSSDMCTPIFMTVPRDRNGCAPSFVAVPRNRNRCAPSFVTVPRGPSQSE